MKLFLGVDGGQSSTVGLIADETGRVLGAGRGGPCNHVATTEGRQKFERAMSECLGEACLQAGLDMRTICFEAVCLGFSGGVADKESYSRGFFHSNAFKITIDAEVALTGATAGKPGIIVIAGTGSIAFGKNAPGQTARAGGWGYIFGDEGGAFDITRQALRASLAMEEGWGASTRLLEKLIGITGSTSANELMHAWYNAFDRAEIGRFARLVDEAANDGDSVALGILKDAGQKLAGLVKHLHRKLFDQEKEVAVAYVGGVFESGLVVEELRRELRSAIACEALAPMLPPAAGALIEALQLAGRSVRLSNVPAIKS